MTGERILACQHSPPLHLDQPSLSAQDVKTFCCPADQQPPRWSISKHSITKWHNTATVETRSFSEWQRRTDWTSEERWCLVNWIMAWVTEDFHTTLRLGNLSVRSCEEEKGTSQEPGVLGSGKEATIRQKQSCYYLMLILAKKAENLA